FTIILSDDLHVNERNFESMFKAMAAIPQVKVTPLTGGKHLWNKYGDYAGVAVVVQRALSLEGHSAEQLANLETKVLGIRVNAFEIAKAEILSFVLAAKDNWYGQPVPNDTSIIFRKLFLEDPTILRLNLAAVLVWADIY